jgi:hypothetical protein
MCASCARINWMPQYQQTPHVAATVNAVPLHVIVLPLQRFAHIEETYQQVMQQQQTAQEQARQLSSDHARDMRQLQAALEECQAERTRLAAAEELYKKRNEELYKQVRC